MKTGTIKDTPAITMLQQHEVEFTPYEFEYADKGGTSVSSQALGVNEHDVVKTLVMVNERGEGLVVLMHGDCKVDTKALALQISARKVSPAAPEHAEVLSGYLVGGTSPFGLKTSMKIYVEKSILDLPLIYINGGQRGYLVSMKPRELLRVIHAIPVNVAKK